jgi:tetratricopeptide (TPR) repeat protein
MASRSEKFARKPSSPAPKNEPSKEPEPEEVIKFSPEEEAVRLRPFHPFPSKTPKLSKLCKQNLLNESNKKKTTANELFGKTEFQDALDTYDAAVAICPNYLDYEVAVLKSNIAACYLKMEDWKDAVKAASAALDGLDKLQGKNIEGKEEGKGEVKEDGEEEMEEIISEGATKAEDTSEKGKREADIERIRAKALMRRARARSEIGGWSTLQGAEDGKFPFSWWCCAELI